MYDYIPIELQYDIINRLPVKSILAFRNVSKQWKSYIDSSDFIQQYGCRETANCSFTLTYEQGFQSFMCMVNEDFQFTPLNSNLQLSCLSPIGTSEGLWCFSYGSNMMTVLWNPSIRKSIGVFIPYFVSQLGVEKLSFGFGVRLDTLDPTLLKISYPYGGHGPWFMNVYTVSTSSWYPVKNHRLPRETVRIRKRSGQAVLGRFIYWVGYEKILGDDGIFTKTYVLVSFDLINHHFQVFEIPQQLRDVLPSPFHISQLRSLIVHSRTSVMVTSTSCGYGFSGADGFCYAV
ncbi:F-box domain containing protein [Tanacetum coccineum]